MKYPTLEEVEAADRLQICRWMRFLEVTRDENEQKAMFGLIDRFVEFGGFNAELSKKVGWKPEEKVR